MKIYDIVKNILIYHPETRDSDKQLLWRYIEDTRGPLLSREIFLSLPSFETITRARRKIQELHPELKAKDFIKTKRLEKEQSKGTFIFKENE